ncbi:hypothetical protein PR202_gb04377 [Eleusine coracana subsp. coracana]|uniref:Uncharacterized protein n=1 Tax=Eleusine coracana subsp. coracana TaxID=191504 RepID=A0AAV5E577_ELECO|nr:hypothetical protein PR202_gb04377 [Eleusine coracana subsp. coracana]
MVKLVTERWIIHTPHQTATVNSRLVPGGPHHVLSSNPRNPTTTPAPKVVATGKGPSAQAENTFRSHHPQLRSPHPPRAGVAMTATSRAPRTRSRIRPRGPPPAPTPIRTARGARSAAADDRVLAEFLETSLRVPDLTLPPQNRKRFQFPPPPPELTSVAAHALLSGESSSDAAALIAAAAESGGAFSVVGAVGAGEVREAIQASEALFAAPEEERELGRWFSRRDHPVAGEEFCWFRPMSSDDDRALEAAQPGSTYRVFSWPANLLVSTETIEATIASVMGQTEELVQYTTQRPNLVWDGRPTYRVMEKMDAVASKMEDVAKRVVRVLSDNVNNANGSTPSGDAISILRLTLHSSEMSKAFWNDSGSSSTEPPNSHALSIRLSGNDHQICLRNQSGSAVFSLPAGSMLVTVGKQIQEWSNGEFKTAAGEVLYEKTGEQDRLITLELLYSPRDLHLSEAGRYARCIDRPKIVAFRDQILVALVLLSLFYLFWS